MRLIDADALFETLVTGDIRETHQFCYPCKKVLEAIDAQPTVEPQRMKGRWVGTDYDGFADGNPVYDEWKCSECGCVVEDEEPTWNYCPNCGAEMETEQQ